MSEIASKANARLTSNLTQPLFKKDDAAAHKMLFAALFGSGVVAEDVADPMVGGLAPVNAESDTDANQHGNADILAATQAVAMMVSGQRGTALKDELSADLDKSAKDSSFIFEDDDIIGVNPMMIGPMPMQQQTGTSLPVTDTSAVMAQMAFEDEVTMLRQNKGRAVLNTLISSPHPSGAQSQMSELSSSFSPQTIKSFEKPQSLVDSIDDMLNSELDIDVSPLRSDGRTDARPTFRPATYQLNINTK